MYKNSQYFRTVAKQKCQMYGNILALIYLVYALIAGLAGGASQVLAVVGIVISGPFIYSLHFISKKVYHAREVKIDNLFDGFKVFTKTLVIYLLNTIFVTLWSLLFIIPGIIKYYAYSMAYYVSIDNPDMTADECITESRKIMDGNKMRLFCLQMSYLGWIILSIFTFGILLLWVAPKMQVATYAFYYEVSGKKQRDEDRLRQLEEEKLLAEQAEKEQPTEE